MSCYRDLNPGPLPYQGSALPLSYNSKENKSCGQRWIRTTEGVSQQIYSLPHLATLVTSLVLSAAVSRSGLNPSSSESAFRADGGIRTHDQLITNQLLWPTELHRQYSPFWIAKVGIKILSRKLFGIKFPLFSLFSKNPAGPPRNRR